MDGGGVTLVFAEHLRAASVPLSSTLSGVDCLVAKVPTRRGRLNLAAVYRPPTSCRYGVPVAQFCCEFGDLLDELLALPGQLIVCGDFNCPGAVGGTVDDRLLDVLVSRNLVQRVDVPTHKDGSTLDLLAHVDGADTTSVVSVVDVGFSDHLLLETLLLETDVNLQRPKPDVLRYTFRNIRRIDADEFAERLLQTDAYTAPSDDVDGFTSQLERSVTAVLDTLAPLQSRTKCSGKTNSRWLSEAAVAAKRERRQLECRWKRTQLESDCVAYRAACRVANTKINSSRSAFYNDRLTEASGDQRTAWRVAKELLHSDSRPAVCSPRNAAQLCVGFCRFFTDKLAKISDTVGLHLSTAGAYYR